MKLTSEDQQSIRDLAAERVDEVANLAVRICNVPSPTGLERERAEFIAELLRERGYAPDIDEVNNVCARRGNRGGNVIMLEAHIDTVFPPSVEINAFRDGDVLRGPGIGDNSLRVAGMIATLDMLDELGIETDVDLVVVGTVGEEGLGNLRGIRTAVEKYRDDLGAVIVLDGALGRITNTAVGSSRWKATVNGPGGHSFGAFGLPSAIHGLGRIIAAIADLDVPEEPKTTFNVGLIEGGTSVNTIAPTASAVIDMRSTGVAELEELTNQVRSIIEIQPGEGLTTEIEVVGERPAGSRSQDDPLMQLTAEGLAWLGYEPEYHAASTNMNIPISLDISTVCVGISNGGEHGHTVNEYVPVPPVADGMAHLVWLVVEASAKVANGQL